MGINLVIVEVSQKQAYIFGSNKLKDNILNSNVIAYVTSSRYFQQCAPDFYNEEDNEVYCGGGHAVLQFENHELAVKFVQAVTLDANVRFPNLEMFAATYECEGEPKPKDITALIQKLEKKKAVRRASFVQGSFGVEEIDSSSRDVNIFKVNGEIYEKYEPDDQFDRDAYPKDFQRAYRFEDLGASKGDSSFIAVVHIDGNAMGKRVEGIRKKHGGEENYSWSNYRKVLKNFSDAIDADFKGTFSDMCRVIAGNITEDGKLGDIQLKADKSGNYFFPVRRVITEGDDICFVTDGRIGIECARIFAELISKRVNHVDGQSYAVGAGVAIVHQKYPFYMAYELAELLCSNAKKFIANSTKDFKGADASNVSVIDWHIDFGELGDSIDDIRNRYNTADGKRLELRPYILCGPESYLHKENYRCYSNFRKIMAVLNGEGNDHAKTEDDYARGKLKNLRIYLREGEKASLNYIIANRMQEIILKCYFGIYREADISKVGSGEGQEWELFVRTTDGRDRSILFDAVEVMDTFLLLDSPCAGEKQGVDKK